MMTDIKQLHAVIFFKKLNQCEVTIILKVIYCDYQVPNKRCILMNTLKYTHMHVRQMHSLKQMYIAENSPNSVALSYSIE